MSTVSVGNKGEELACAFLVKNGYRILGRNFRIRGGEVDIIASDKNILVFVEVKARYSHSYGLPIESITPWKVRALQKTALVYIQKIHWGDKPYRFDLISIDYAESFNNPKVELMKNFTF